MNCNSDYLKNKNMNFKADYLKKSLAELHLIVVILHTGSVSSFEMLSIIFKIGKILHERHL